MGDAFPCAAGAVAAAEFAGEAVEIVAGLVLALAEDELEGGDIGLRLGGFLRAGGDEGADLGVEGVVVAEGVEDVFAGAPVADELCGLELGEMGGDAGLAHAEDLLKLRDGELLTLEEMEEA